MRAAPPFTNLPETLMQTPASFLASVSDATTTAAAGAATALPPANETSQARAVADVAVDAWTVSGGTTLGARFAGVESKLYQAKPPALPRLLVVLGMDGLGSLPHVIELLHVIRPWTRSMRGCCIPNPKP